MKMSKSDEVVDSKNSGSERNPSMKRSADSTDTSKDDDFDDEPKKKIVFGLKKPSGSSVKPFTDLRQTKKISSNISIRLGSTQKAAAAAPVTSLKPKVGKAALAFSQEDEDEEEMPPEAKMRMKNIGRDTPTSSGPNSFGKSRMGFCDSKKIYERKLKEIEDKLEEQ